VSVYSFACCLRTYHYVTPSITQASKLNDLSHLPFWSIPKHDTVLANAYAKEKAKYIRALYLYPPPQHSALTPRERNPPSKQ
jgi:hypothetical protein